MTTNSNHKENSNVNEYLYSLFTLRNKIALLTGAAGHLGGAMAEVLGMAGAHVVLCGRNVQRLTEVQENLKSLKIESTVIGTDITNNQSMIDMLEVIEKHFKRLDIIVNNAHSGRACEFQDSNKEDFLRDYNINVVAVFDIIKHAIPLLKNAINVNSDASIINIASMYGTVSPDPRIYGESKMNNPPHYGAAKAGMIQLTKYMACHLAKDRIRVNAISPGPFPNEKSINDLTDFRNRLIEKTPMNRIGQPYELRGPLLLLASSASSYMTGVNIPVDGGWTAW
ncbi:MAG: SDR family NAD(P)-dependent oxidoreductase [Candidatus Berkiella sp.]